ncbi:MAG: DUF1566 domain-containing protein [Deltaproteobacteria bacterium]|nr:MAG: DUF1566 domain-containing protein [Deltaproteobacteria bacterium]
MAKKFLVSLMLCLLLMVCPLLVAQAGERFIDNGDGTVTDTLTNLMWAQADNMGDITWHDAQIYCKTPPIAGYKYLDWRLPTILELRTLYNKDLEGYESDCGLEVKIYPIIRLSCAWVWTIDSEAISAYAFSFRKGYHYSTLMLTKKNFRALPVRTIK